MFVRFRQTRARLQVNLTESRRVDGRVRREHVASLGSVALSPTALERLEFWRSVHARLARLANRLNPETQACVLGALHARVPIVTQGEQAALQVETAKADASLWRSIERLNSDSAADHCQLAETASTAATSLAENASQAAARAVKAENLAAQIERGEAAGTCVAR